jgi:gas vesicle protein
MSVFLRFLSGSLLGGLLGAIIGLLLAPRSGKDTRSIIQKEFETRYKDSKLETLLAEKSSEWKEKSDELKDKAQRTGDDLKQKAQHLTEELEATGRRYLAPDRRPDGDE